MSNSINATLIFIIALLFLKCASLSKSDKPADIDFKQLVEQKIGSPITYINNSSNDKVLCLNLNTGQGRPPREKVKFMVWDFDAQTILYQSSIDGGAVKWYDANHLEVFRTPGFVQSGESMEKYTQIIHVVSKKAVNKEVFMKVNDL